SDCLAYVPEKAARCPACGSPRLARHRELDQLTIAHVDCDAFYATIEKRDDPSLVDKPVIVGGGKRGVVAAACYVARTYGIRSAMPMFEGLHGMSAAKVLARFAGEVERDLGITVSIGLSANKFLAKIASDMDKPRGFAVLGEPGAAAFLAPKPVGFIYGVGAVSAAKLAADGYRLIADLQHAEEHDLIRRYGEEGARLWHLARGIDARAVDPERDTKSISAETTFERDIGEFRPLEHHLWELTERVSARLK